MPKSRYTEEQIAYAVRQAEAGVPIAKIVRKYGIAAATFYRWRRQFSGLGVSEIRRLKQLVEEKTKLKRLVADQALDNQMIWGRPSAPRQDPLHSVGSADS